MKNENKPLIRSKVKIGLSLFVGFLVFSSAFAQKVSSIDNGFEKNDSELIDKYIKSLGDKTIVFDGSNIKQFWVDKTVSGQNNEIIILMTSKSKNENESDTFKIQLDNVIETQDCKIRVITKIDDLSFSITDSKMNILSDSAFEEKIINYNVSSATVHLENTESFAFGITLSTPAAEKIVQIKKIVLSFSENQESAFKGSPGFNTLSELIDAKGITIPGSDYKYYISDKKDRIYFKIPNETADQYRFFYHAYPIEKENLLEDRIASGFNNFDFNIKSKYAVVPKPYLCESEYTIIQRPLPSYNCSKIFFGQLIEKGKRLWTLDIRNFMRD